MVYFLFAFSRPAALENLLCILSIAASGYFAFRYFALKRALRELDRDLREIQTDFSQNRILRLPLPDRDLERFSTSVNDTLEKVRQERQAYAEHEREFQKQIEHISHDLRTPLTVILGYLKWMKRKESVPAASPDLAETLDTIEGSAHAMERLVAQFYTFSRLSGQDYELELQETDICRLLRESLAYHYPILEKASIHPDSILPEHPVSVLGDQNALERIFANLFQNAARYGCSCLHIRMEKTEAAQVRILFENDSDKLTEEDIPHLFDRFYRSDPSRSRNSSGLGLTIARSLAELMGGSLEAEMIREPHKKDEADDARPAVRFILTLPEAVR